MIEMTKVHCAGLCVYGGGLWVGLLVDYGGGLWVGLLGD